MRAALYEQGAAAKQMGTEGMGDLHPMLRTQLTLLPSPLHGRAVKHGLASVALLAHGTRRTPEDAGMYTTPVALDTSWNDDDVEHTGVGAGVGVVPDDVLALHAISVTQDFDVELLHGDFMTQPELSPSPDFQRVPLHGTAIRQLRMDEQRWYETPAPLVVERVNPTAAMRSWMGVVHGRGVVVVRVVLAVVVRVTVVLAVVVVVGMHASMERQVSAPVVSLHGLVAMHTGSVDEHAVWLKHPDAAHGPNVKPDVARVSDTPEDAALKRTAEAARQHPLVLPPFPPPLPLLPESANTPVCVREHSRKQNNEISNHNFRSTNKTQNC